VYRWQEVVRMTRFSAVVAGLMVGAVFGCARGPAPQANVPPLAVVAGQGLVYLSAGGRIAVLDAASGQVARELPAGTPSPDWRWVYTVGQGQLQKVDPATGQAAASMPAPEWAQGVRTSADGSWLVLTGASTGPPSRFEVVDNAFARKPVTVTLPGSFTFDGLSNDGMRLYLLEWVRAGSYQVRMYDLARGLLYSKVIADKREVGQLMSGQALTSLTTSDGSAQLTLYQQSAKNEAFVHELPIGQDPLSVPFAWCEDLPAPASGWGFVKGTRDHFYAVNPQAGWVVDLKSRFSGAGRNPRQAHTGITAGAPANGQPPAAAVSPDGDRLVLSTWPGLVVVDTGNLKVTGRFLEGEHLRGLDFARDGSALYAVSQAGSLLRIDPRTMSKVSDITLGAPLEAILHAM
jgi:hypothetical protein